MRKNKIIVLFSLALLSLSSCSDELDKKLEMDVWATALNSQMIGDTLVVSKDEPITFNIAGNPDFITFFSGEAGREYSKRNQTEIPLEEIASAELKFTAFAQYGIVPNTMNVFLSTSYEGMFGVGNKKADSLRIEETAWIDITEQCKLPTASNGTSNVVIPLDEYLGKRLTIGFLYDPKQNTSTQPTWEIQNLNVVNESKITGLKTQIPAMTLGFNAFDMYASEDVAYVSGTGPGIWGITSARLRISSSGAGNPINKDWMITKPFIINSRIPDSGVGIKNIANNALQTYNYTYQSPGVYVVTFIARNSNIEHSSEIVREVILKIVE